ncbi:MAG: NAD-dependent epimerase/dehydratase family protein, partial [Alphaproteobacteria bacterium]
MTVHLASAGHHVRALTRRAMAPQAAVTWVAGSLEDSRALDVLCQGADALIHGAALIKARRAADFLAVNAGGTRTVLAAAQRAGTRRVVLLSSLAARLPGLSAYAASKKAAEDVLAQAFASAFDWTILRIPAVYGPGDRETLKLFQMLRWRLALVPGRDARASVIHVADLCAALTACLDAPLTHGHVLDIGDGKATGHRLADLYRAAGALMDVRPLVLAVPRAVLVAAGGLNRG